MDLAGVGKRLLKIEDVANIGLPPTIDRLVGIADHEEIPVPLGESATRTYCTRFVS